MFDKDEFKKSLTIDDIKKVMDYYGAGYFEGQDGALISQTVCHNRSGGSYKLYYYPADHIFNCYTGCGSFDIYDLVEKVNNTRGNKIGFRQAIQELAKILGKQINTTERIKGVKTSVKLIKDWEWLQRLQVREKVVPELTVLNPKILTFFSTLYPSSWYEEGISLESMEKYNIKFYPEMFQTVIPHYDVNGNLIGIRSRNWDKELAKKAKYIPTYIGSKGYNHPLSYALYGLFQNKETIKKKKKVMIVEGEKSCLFADTFYGDDNFVVAICGSNMSRYQADLLLDLGVEQVIIGLDKDYMFVDTPEYDDYIKKVKKIARLFAPYTSVYHITDTRSFLAYKESPLDASREELEDIMEHDKHLITLKDLEK